MCRRKPISRLYDRKQTASLEVDLRKEAEKILEDGDVLHLLKFSVCDSAIASKWGDC